MSLRPVSTRQDAPQEFPFSEKEFRYLAELLYAKTGIVLNASKMNMVYARLARRLRELGLASFADYCSLIKGQGSDAEIGILINALTTNLTRFFREPHHFEHLRNTVLPAAAAQKGTGTKRLRIWSAGCSSGEEPYSIAMVLAEFLGSHHQWDARILATDLDTTMVAAGHSGIYPQAGFEGIPHQVRDRHFSPRDNGTWSANPELRKFLTFKQLNLMEDWPIRGPFDAIFCRNVMIYFDTPTKNRLVGRFCDLLAPGGWLYVGHSETLFDHRTNLVPDGRTQYRKATP